MRISKIMSRMSIMRIGFCTPHKLPCPIFVNGSGKLGTLWPLVKMKMIPRTTLSIPRVVIRGFISILTIKRPLIQPKNMQAARPMIMENTIGIPLLRNIPVITPPKPRTDPTDRSKPPEIRSKVMPIATIKFCDTLKRRACIFAFVRKLGDRMVITMNTPSIKSDTSSSWVFSTVFVFVHVVFSAMSVTNQPSMQNISWTFSAFFFLLHQTV